MSRAFSTASRALKEINWKLNGTTEPVDWAKKNVETAVDKIAGLGDKVQDGIINGNPHPNGDDPTHVSGLIGKKNIKGKDRVTSFHAYPDGTVKFSDKALPVIKVDNPAPGAPESK